MKHLYIVCGDPGAGKSTFSEVVKNNYSGESSVEVMSMGDIVRDLAEDRGCSTSKEIGEFAKEHRERHGEGIFGKLLIEQTEFPEESIVVVEGLRSPEEYQLLKETAPCEVTLVYIDAPEDDRFNRLRERGREDEGNMTEEEFRERTERERDFGIRAVKQQKMYDQYIMNNSSLSDFELSITRLVDRTL